MTENIVQRLRRNIEDYEDVVQNHFFNLKFVQVPVERLQRIRELPSFILPQKTGLATSGGIISAPEMKLYESVNLELASDRLPILKVKFNKNKLFSMEELEAKDVQALKEIVQSLGIAPSGGKDQLILTIRGAYRRLGSE